MAAKCLQKYTMTYEAILRFVFLLISNMLLSDHMFTYSYIQVSHTFTIIALIAESTLILKRKVFKNAIFELKDTT